MISYCLLLTVVGTSHFLLKNHSLLLLCEFDQLEQLNTNLKVEQNVSLTNYSMNIFSMRDSRELSEEYGSNT